jgi:dihydrolipoamide dehydrogenase
VPVTIVEQEAQLLPGDDAEAVRVLARSLQARGVAIHTGTSVRTLTASGQGVQAVLSTGTMIEASCCLVAIGLCPNSDGLGLEALGIETAGGVHVDAGLRTTQRHIAAIGDCIRGGGLAHQASAEGALAVDNLAHDTSTALDESLVPGCVYTDPELAQVGLTEAEAESSVRVSRFSFAALGKSMCDDEPDGFVKLLADPSTDRVLGATIVGTQASSLIHPAVLAMTHGLTAKQLARTITAHPTLAEGLTEAAAQFYQEALYTAGSVRPPRSRTSQQTFSSNLERGR